MIWLDEIEPPQLYSEEQIQDIIDTTLTFSDQVDALAKARGWFRPGLPGWFTVPVLDSYLSGVLTVNQAVDQLATPIERAWVEDLNSTEQVRSVRDAESGLLDLWFGVIHAAKKSPWDDETSSSQQKLLDLLQTFKDRADPEINEEKFPRRADNWLHDWCEGRLWTNLAVISLAVAESRNDSPSSYPICTEPEIRAFLNLNAFWARTAVAGVRDMWDIASGFMAVSTYGRSLGTYGLDRDGVRFEYRVVFLWMTLAGNEWWNKCCEGPQVGEAPLDVNTVSKRCPWNRGSGYATEVVFAKAQWRWWKGRFGLAVASKGDRYSEASKHFAQTIQVLMEDIENGKTKIASSSSSTPSAGI